ncbi:hypothetical protein HG531_010269 [Fusarium graminearum]|nr:hypothetical protein HG531_010269 [Fusarium graminearum]
MADGVQSGNDNIGLSNGGYIKVDERASAVNRRGAEIGQSTKLVTKCFPVVERAVTNTKQCRKLALHGQSLGRVLRGSNVVFVQILKGNAAEGGQIVFDQHVGRHGILTEPNHTTTTDSSQSCILQGLDFEHDSNVGGKVETLTIGKREQLVVIEYTVQVFNPFRVHVTIEDDPMSFRVLTTEVVDDLSQNAGEQTICPFTVTNHHNTMVDFLNLVQLEDLGHPKFVDHEVTFGSKGSDSVFQCYKVGRDILHAREAVGFDGHHDVDIRLDKLRRNRFPDALHDDFRFNNLFSTKSSIA